MYEITPRMAERGKQMFIFTLMANFLLIFLLVTSRGKIEGARLGGVVVLSIIVGIYVLTSFL